LRPRFPGHEEVEDHTIEVLGCLDVAAVPDARQQSERRIRDPNAKLVSDFERRAGVAVALDQQSGSHDARDERAEILSACACERAKTGRMEVPQRCTELAHDGRWCRRREHGRQ
jgi:hypothetical protein